MIYFYYGDNDYGIKQQVSSVINKFVAKYGNDNVTKFDSTDIEKSFAELINKGLFSNNRLFILEGVFANKHLVEGLAGVLPLIPEGTDLIITDSKPDKRTKLYKVLMNENAEEFILPKNLNQFVVDEARKQGVKVEGNAIEDLIAYTSGDVWRIVNEIAKLKTLNINLSQENVKKYIEPDNSINVFQILNNIFDQQPKKALDNIRSIKQNEDPNRFLALLSSQIFALSVAANSEKPSAMAAKEAGVHPYVMNNMFRLASKTSQAKIAKIAKIVAEADAKIKLSNKNEAWVLIELVVSKI